MDIQINTGEYTVLYSGVVLLINNEDTVISFPEKYGSYKFIIEIIDDEKIEIKNSTSFELKNNTTLLIKLINIGNETVENTDIFDLGTLPDGKKLYLNFRIIGNSSLLRRVLFYSFLTKKQI